MIKEFNKLEDILMLWLLEDPKYSNQITRYLEALIYLCKKVIYVYQIDNSIVLSNLCKDKIILEDFSYSQVKTIIQSLKKKKILK